MLPSAISSLFVSILSEFYVRHTSQYPRSEAPSKVGALSEAGRSRQTHTREHVRHTLYEGEAASCKRSIEQCMRVDLPQPLQFHKLWFFLFFFLSRRN